MEKNKPRDFFRYPMGEEDLIRFDIPDQEKELKQKLSFIREGIVSRLQNVSSDMIFNEMVFNYQLKDRHAVQQSEVLWRGKRYELSEWLIKGFQTTLNVASIY